MRACVLRGSGQPLVLENRSVPAIAGDEVLVRVRACGVCGSDLHVADGRFDRLALPLVPGHEIAGETEDLGPVLVYGMWGCGSCVWCRRGLFQFCKSALSPGFERDGGYAEAVVVPSPNFLVPIDGMDPIKAAPLADAGLTSYHVVKRAMRDLVSGQEVAIIGSGGLGQFAIQWLKQLSPVHVIAIDTSPSKLQRALALGADEARLDDDPIGPVQAVIDFVGTDATLALGSSLVEPSGSLLLVGEAGGSLSFGIGAVPWETSYATSLWGSIAELGEVVRYAKAGVLQWDVEPLPLEEANRALDRLRAGDATDRLVLVPSP